MVLGDGDGNSRFGRFAGIFKPGSMVASLDIIAHELTHGMTQHTAKLKYELQSGAFERVDLGCFCIYGGSMESRPNCARSRLAHRR